MDEFGLSEKQEAILLMESLGFPLIKLKGKIPARHSWQETTKSEIDLGWGGNYGVVLNHSTLVIDVDPKSFPDGRNVAKELLEFLGINKFTDLNTLTVTTGSGGLHIYLRKPKDLFTSWKKGKFPGIEFRTFGQQMVGPYCLHPDTRKEYVFRSEVRTIADAPQKLLDLVKKEAPEEKLQGVEAIDNDGETITKFIKYLEKQEGAIEGQGGDNATYQIACKGKDFGLSKEMVHYLMLNFWNSKCNPPWNSEHLLEKINNAYTYGEKIIGSDNVLTQFKHINEDPKDNIIKINWDVKSNKELKPTLNNAVNYFILPTTGLKDILRYNLLTKEIEFRTSAPWHTDNNYHNKCWTDGDAVNCRFMLSAKHRFDVPASLLNEAALVTAHAKKYNPLTDYLDGLKWDGVPRLNTWIIKYLNGENNIYVKTVSAKILIAAVARAYKPGAKFDYVLVLEGDQGVGKSSAIEILGGPFYADVKLDPSNKDTVAAINSRWIIEISEMTANRKSDADEMKAFISRRSDRVRPAYARHIEDFPRSCIFMGTINPEHDMGYLKDTTGNRRFWPVRVGYTNFKELEEDRDLIWAEAVQRFKNGETLDIRDKKINGMALYEASQRQIKDAWIPIVARYLKDIQNIDGVKIDVVYADQVWREALRGTEATYDMRQKARINSVMSALGWEGKKAFDPVMDSTRFGYHRPPIDTNGNDL